MLTHFNASNLINILNNKIINDAKSFNAGRKYWKTVNNNNNNGSAMRKRERAK